MAELLPFEDPARRCLKVEQWPEPDQIAWHRLLGSGDILDDTVGEGCHWRAQTREKYRKGYGRWLNFLMRSEPESLDEHPVDRVTPDRVRVYADELKAQDIASWTLWGRLAELLAVLSAMEPDQDLAWLIRTVRYFERTGKDRRDKLRRLQPTHKILAWSLNRMAEIRRMPPKRDWAGSYRDALMVGLLAICPIRLGNFTMIQIGRHLVRNGESYLLRFEGPETKTGHHLTMPVLDALVEPINHYCQVVRPILLSGNRSDRLWITRYGQAMNDKMMHLAITRTTERAFGRSINPHLFRDCAVTQVALEDPEHIGIAAPLLGHVDPRTTEKHYIQANQTIAGRRLRDSIKKLRKHLEGGQSPDPRTRRKTR